jgi:hypothetical protein
MSGLGKRERAALEAVARHFSATWEKGEAPPDAYLTIARKRIAVEVTTTKQRIAGRGGLTKPRLRFDRVALRVIRRLQAALSASVPDGTTLILTITAPIRVPSKTAAALEDDIRTYLERKSARGEAKYTIHGNQIRVRLVNGGSRRTTKVIGFVHNPDSDPDGLFDITLALIERIGAKARNGAPAGSGRSMARSRRRRAVLAYGDVSTRLFPAVRSDRLQEDSDGSC